MSRNYAPTALAVFVGAVLGTLMLGSASLGHTPWYVSRASGLVAYVLLTASVVFGLVISTRSPKPLLPRQLAFDLHQFLSLLTLTLVAVHIGILLFDGFLQFSVAGLLVPFVTDYKPLLSAIGIISAWSLVAITASFWMRKRIGQKAWRKLHYVSFASWLLALIHGFGAGSDTALPLVSWMYVLSAALVAGLLTYRIGFRSGTRAPGTTPPPQAGAARNSRRLASRAASD